MFYDFSTVHGIFQCAAIHHLVHYLASFIILSSLSTFLGLIHTHCLQHSLSGIFFYSFHLFKFFSTQSLLLLAATFCRTKTPAGIQIVRGPNNRKDRLINEGDRRIGLNCLVAQLGRSLPPDRNQTSEASLTFSTKCSLQLLNSAIAF